MCLAGGLWSGEPSVKGQPWTESSGPSSSRPESRARCVRAVRRRSRRWRPQGRRPRPCVSRAADVRERDALVVVLQDLLVVRAFERHALRTPLRHTHGVTEALPDEVEARGYRIEPLVLMDADEAAVGVDHVVVTR